MSFVTLDQAKEHLRVDVPDEDAVIALKLAAAEVYACEYLNRQVYADQGALDAAVAAGTAGPAPMVVNALVQCAVLLILGHLYNNREDVVTGTIATDLPMGAHALLDRYRRSPGV